MCGPLSIMLKRRSSMLLKSSPSSYSLERVSPVSSSSVDSLPRMIDDGRRCIVVRELLDRDFMRLTRVPWPCVAIGFVPSSQLRGRNPLGRAILPYLGGDEPWSSVIVDDPAETEAEFACRTYMWFGNEWCEGMSFRSGSYCLPS